MMKILFRQVVTKEETATIVRLANTIWKEHYTPIIGREQVTYMLKTYHSFETVSQEVQERSTRYYLLFKEDHAVGYVGVRSEETCLFLSKLYLLSQERGHGFGAQAVDFIKTLAREQQLEKVRLTVNKENFDAISAYKKMGFKVTNKVSADIGEGYVMDDYEMELETAQSEDHKRDMQENI